MFTSPATLEYKEIIKQFGELNVEEHGTHAFNAGYFESLAGELFAQMTKKDQKWEMERMKRELTRALTKKEMR